MILLLIFFCDDAYNYKFQIKKKILNYYLKFKKK